MSGQERASAAVRRFLDTWAFLAVWKLADEGTTWMKDESLALNQAKYQQCSSPQAFAGIFFSPAGLLCFIALTLYSLYNA
ncbi:hypothetical protein [Thermosporothrix hazakensis]|uniref:hypothetical protein n=1 Tax=Thermosporothrix hazakensis TaxID=644383 RepID=UPI000DACF5AB|nr:hypothetical protein [Thermosporothrix hazakensis]